MWAGLWNQGAVLFFIALTIFADESTLPIDDSVCLTATIDILKAIADGTGPNKALLALGYAGWAPGQLDNEIQSNGWLNCPADSKLVFDGALEKKYSQALAKIGVDPSHLVNDAGQCLRRAVTRLFVPLVLFFSEVISFVSFGAGLALALFWFFS